MRWGLLVATVVCAVLLFLFLFLRDDEQERRVATPDVPLSKEDHWRKQQERDNGEDEDGADAETPDANAEIEERLRKKARRPRAPLTLAFEVSFDDGSPAPGATVTLVRDSSAAKTVATATTDKTGIARMDVSSGARFVRASRGALVAGPKRFVPYPNLRQKLRLGEGLTIRGLVVDTNGRPAAGATLSVNFKDEREWRFVEAKTATNGTFTCAAVPVRWIKRMHIYVMAIGMPRNLFEWNEPTTDVRLKLTRETVRGRVIHENGTPAKGMQVNTGERALRTDQEGRFEAAFQRREGQLIRVKNQARVLKAGEREIEIVLRPGKPLSGRLLTHERKPVAYAWINLYLPVGGRLASSETDSQGRFRFAEVAEGPHVLLFRFFTTANADFRVTDVHAAGNSLDIVLPRPILVYLKLSLPDGKPVPENKFGVVVSNQDQRDVLKRFLQRRDHGAFLRFVVWKPGRYDLIVSGVDRVGFTHVEVADAGRDVFEVSLATVGR